MIIFMLNRLDFYAISIEVDERNSKEVEYFETFEEAKENRMRYANWWRPNGDVWILHKNGCTLRTAESWHIDSNGMVVSHYNF